MTPIPKVLVLLAARNGASWITDQLQTILAQQDVNIRLLIRDDCSTDHTCSRIEHFLDDPRVLLLRGKTCSGSASQNFFELIRSYPPDGFDFVSLSDQDDEWNTHKLATACSKLQDSRSDGYSSATVAIWKDKHATTLKQNCRTTPGDFLFGGAGQGCTFVLTADFYRRARDFFTHHRSLTDQIHYHDWALYALARSWGLSWTFDPVPTVRYRQHAANDTGARTTVCGMRKRFTQIRSGWYSKQLQMISSMCLHANQENPTVFAWNSIFGAPTCWRRRLRIARFCLRAGRRSALDNAALMLSALSGWI